MTIQLCYSWGLWGTLPDWPLLRGDRSPHFAVTNYVLLEELMGPPMPPVRHRGSTSSILLNPMVHHA